MGTQKNKARSRKRKVEQPPGPASSQATLTDSEAEGEEPDDQVCARWSLRGAAAVGYPPQLVTQICNYWYTAGVQLAHNTLSAVARQQHAAAAAPAAVVEKMRQGGLQARIAFTDGQFASTQAYLQYGLETAIGKEAAALLPCQGMSLHVMQPGDGPQPPHADLPLRLYNEANRGESAAQTTRENEHAASCYSVLLYTQAGPSTQMQTFTAAQHDLTLRSGQAQWEMLVPQYFTKQQVDMGSLLVMRGDVWHSAPRNDTPLMRVCVYGLFSRQTLDENPAQMSRVTWPAGFGSFSDLF